MMKKFLKTMLILAVTAVFLSACGAEPSEIEKPSDMKILTYCVYKSGEKYGIYHEDEIITEPVYDSFKRQKLGEEDIYILGRVDGTKPCIEYDSDGKPIGVSETERTLYDIFLFNGTRAVNKTADGYVTFKEGFLNISCGGDLFEYSFDANGKFIESGYFPAGKEPSGVDGYDIVTYYYGPDRRSKGAGIVDSDGNEIVPMIYSSVGIYFGDRIVANKVDGFGLSEIGRIYDLEGNIICEKYNRIEYFEFSNGEYLGVASTAGPMSQVGTVIRDENGNEMPKGSRFIDKDGNEISPVFTGSIDFGKPYYSPDNTVTVILSDGTKMDLVIRDYIFYGGGEISSELELVNDISYRENGKYGFHKDGVPVTEAVFDMIIPLEKEFSGKKIYEAVFTDGKRTEFASDPKKGPYLEEVTNTLYYIFDEDANQINDTPLANYYIYEPGSFGNGTEKWFIRGTYNGDYYSYSVKKDGTYHLSEKQSAGTDSIIYNAADGKEYIKTVYHWDHNRTKYGLTDMEGNVILENLYLSISPKSGVIYAYVGVSFQSADEVQLEIYDYDGNLINNQYNYVESVNLDDGYFLVAYCLKNADEVCYDENGNPYETGAWFVDDKGNKLSKRFEYITIKRFMNEESNIWHIDKVIVTDENGSEKEIDYEQYKISYN